MQGYVVIVAMVVYDSVGIGSGWFNCCCQLLNGVLVLLMVVMVAVFVLVSIANVVIIAVIDSCYWGGGEGWCCFKGSGVVYALMVWFV